MKPKVKCSFCELEFTEYQRLHSHLMHSHSDKLWQARYDALKFARKEFRKQDSEKTTKDPKKRSIRPKGQNPKSVRKQKTDSGSSNRKVKLFSRRSERYDESTDCFRCKKRFRSVWKFTNTNHGTVYVCTSCKHKLLGTGGAWGRILYNPVETNRRKH